MANDIARIKENSEGVARTGSAKIVLGELLFRVHTPDHVEPNSPLAEIIASILARSLNERLFEATLEGNMPQYAIIRMEVGELRAGSLLVLLISHVEVFFGAGTAVALTKFAKDYPKIREGVLAITRDIRDIGVTIKHKYKVRVESEKLLTQEQLAVEIEEQIRAALVAVDPKKSRASGLLDSP